MKEFFEKFGGYILVTVAALLAGMFISLNLNSSGNSFLEFKLGQGTCLTLGKNSITSFDLNNITMEEARVIGTKIEQLTYDNPLAKELIAIKENHAGPFKPKQIELLVHFTDDWEGSEPFAAGCNDDAAFLKNISIFQITDDQRLASLGSKDFSVVFDKETSICETIKNKTNTHTIWIAKKCACNWLQIQNKDDLPDKLKVKAQILGRASTYPGRPEKQ
jgi:hypothetical protein